MVEEKREKDDVIFNRRREARIDVELSVSFEISAGGPHNFFTGLTQDISKGGIFIATSQVYPVGTEMQLAFLLEGREMSIKAKVMWIRDPGRATLVGVEPGMGLQFAAVTEEDRKRIDAYIAQRETIYYDSDDE